VKNLKTLVLFLFVFSSFSALSATVDCHNIKLDVVAVEGPRDDGHFFQNKLILKMNKQCSGKIYAHANLNHPAFNGFLSAALSAKATDQSVTVSVNTNNTTISSNQIAYIALNQ
jgi:hypothetical protein